MNQEKSWDKIHQWVGVGVFLAALALYLVTLSPVAFPGESAALIAVHAGLNPFPAMSRVVWGWLCQVLVWLPLGSMAFKLNVFSALCGATGVWFMFKTMVLVQHNRTFEESSTPFSAGLVALITGLFSAAYLAVSTPYWLASTRAHYAPFDTVMLLSSVWMLLRFSAEKKLWQVCVATTLYGIGMSGSPAMIVIFPVFGLLLLYYVWEAGLLRMGVILRLSGLGLLGALPYVLGALHYRMSDAYEWREFTSYGQVGWFFIKDQLGQITGGVPKLGWLAVAFFSFVPWVIVLGMRTPLNQSPSQGMWFGNYVLFASLGIVAVALLFNVKLSPWSLTGVSPLLVTPYIFIASWAGYLAGYWFINLSKQKMLDTALITKTRAACKVAVMIALPVCILASAVYNFNLANGRFAVVVDRYVNQVLDQMQGRTWLITSGALDDSFMIAAQDRKQPLHVINMTAGRSSSYLCYVSSLFDDARLKSIARIGIAPLIKEWLASSTDVVAQVAVAYQPDIWYAGAFEPIPSMVAFMGLPPDAPVDLDALFKAHQQFWKSNTVQTVRRSTILSEPYERMIRAQRSKVANNLGVFLEDRGRADLAPACYDQALAYEENNLSALLNKHNCLKRQELPEAGAVYKKLEAVLKGIKNRAQLWNLAQQSGYIRSPEVYASRGWAWALSGKPALAESNMKRAMELSGDSKAVQVAMADMYMAQNKPSESAETFQRVLRKDPNNVAAVAGLLKLAVKRGDAVEARRHLERLRKLGVSEVDCLSEESALESALGNLQTARDLLKKIVKLQPDRYQAWSSLALLAAQMKDEKAMDEAMSKLKLAKISQPGILLVMAQVALIRSDREFARQKLDQTLRIQPGSKQALEMLLKLDLFEGKKVDAEKHVELLLNVDSVNALANYVYGSLQVAHGQLELAVSSYETSLATMPSPEAYNDLAWLIFLRKQYDRALDLSRKSLALDDRNGAAWDTYANIQLALNNVDEASTAIQKALTLRPGSASLQFTLAKIYEKKGLRDEGTKLVDDLMSRPNELSHEAFDELREIALRLSTEK